MNTDLIAYYKARAAEYEKVYALPERQEDIQSCEKTLQQLFAGKTLLEAACGTGYWTERIARTAAEIVAFDINEPVLDVARKKEYAPAQVSFQQADLYHFPCPKPYENLFGGFIWSHVLLQDIDRFVDTLHQYVLPGGMVVFMDNNYVAGSNYPIADIDAAGNTFQTRTLENGTVHKVLKNFPDPAFFEEKLAGKASDLEVIDTQYYWILKYRVI